MIRITIFFILLTLLSCNKKTKNKIEIEFKKPITINFISYDSLDLLKDEVVYNDYKTLNARFNFENDTISLFLIDSNHNKVFNDSTDILFISPSCHDKPKNINFNNKLGIKSSRLFSNNGIAFSVENIIKTKTNYKAKIKKLDSNYKIPNENKMISRIPNLSFTNLENKSLKFNDFKNQDKLIYVEFWATWCTPCIAMIPEIKKIKDEYPNDLEIITIHAERRFDLKKINEFIEKYQMNWTNGISTNEINNSFNCGAYPKGFLFNQNGELLIYDATPILIKDYLKNKTH